MVPSPRLSLSFVWLPAAIWRSAAIYLLWTIDTLFGHPWVCSRDSLKAELERSKELSDTSSEPERRLRAFRSLRTAAALLLVLTSVASFGEMNAPIWWYADIGGGICEFLLCQNPNLNGFVVFSGRLRNKCRIRS